MTDHVIYCIIGGVVGYCIAETLFTPLIERIYIWWWGTRTSKPFFDETVEEMMERTAELMLESMRERREQKGEKKWKKNREI